MLPMLFEKGSLKKRLQDAADRAVRTGALLPIPTDYTFIEDKGVLFFVRVLSALRRKDEEKYRQRRAAEAGGTVDPFLPPEKDLVVADISDTHIAVLNKFNVVDRHILIVTRRFENQEMLLTLKDFEALWLCMSEYDSLGFYNGGRDAGASQQHKHLQSVPLPLAPEGPAVPIEPLLNDVKWKDGIGTISGFSFEHAFMRLDDDTADQPYDAAKASFFIYRRMLLKLGFDAPEENGLVRQSYPYCLLVTRGWMLLVPRSHEFFEDISLNSLAFAGSFFVRDEAQLERLRSYGPMNVLRSVSVAPKVVIPSSG